MNIFLGNPPENIKQWIIDDYNRKQEEKLKIPLCFEAVDAGATIALKCNGNNLKTATFQTSTDGQNWSDYTYATNITLTNAGDKVYFKAKADNTSISRTASNFLLFTTTQAAKKVKVSGNVMSLLAPEFSQMKSVSSYCFYSLFYNCKNISDCSSMTLPATKLASNCYSCMFQSCTSLTQAPALPATTLARSCYDSMFQSCTSLTQAPELPATKLASNCYSCMFQSCTSLTQAPALPATTLAISCYYYMFSGCTSLTQAPAIKTYKPNLSAFDSTLGMFDYNTNAWGQLTSCNWPDLTLSDAESMVLNEPIFGTDNPGASVRINITCKDGSGVAYFDSGKSSWVFEH